MKNLMPGRSLFSSPKVQAPPPQPTREDPAVAAAREKLRLSRKRRRGRASTILTDLADTGGSEKLG